MAQAGAGAPNQTEAEKSQHGSSQAARHGGFWALLIGSIGVVFGDIGTSPIYAFKESIRHVAEDGVARGEVIGIISLIFWALTILVTVKYVILVLAMDNKGEGGTLALMALVQRAIGRRTALIFLIGVFGAALFYGDAIITPAISVLSAVEGLEQVPGLEGRISQQLVLAIACGILVGVFFIQSRGTGRVGAWFGPITLIWFLTMGFLGAIHLADDPEILLAVNPANAVTFIVSHPGLSFVVLGSVFLAVTGAEALYADMGHFGKAPIRAGWLAIVLPCLMLNYFGQGAMVLAHPETIENPFFLMTPEWARLPFVILATAATIIASQAVISGAFSLTQQAIQLGLLPRMEIRRTSETQYGQIYMPQVNWMLLAGVLLLTLAFGSSSALAAAYGIAITGVMMMSSGMAFVVMWRMWKWPAPLAAAAMIPFFLLEAVFMASNLTKFVEGGFVPVLLALGLVVVIWTWVRGTGILADTTRREEPLTKLFETLSLHPPHRVRGTAIFLTGDPDVAPAALMHNLKHNQVLHETIIILTVKTLQTPRAPDSERIKVADMLPDVKRVTLTFGFMETPNVVKALTAARAKGLKFDIMKTSFFLSRRTIVPSERSGMPLWQDHLFIFLARNSTNATDFFHIPSGRAVELGNQVMV
ncbi:MAG: potassium transporter Kup [Hyphomonadaceae bacterium]